jgi:hypothetical protein
VICISGVELASSTPLIAPLFAAIILKPLMIMADTQLRIPPAAAAFSDLGILVRFRVL